MSDLLTRRVGTGSFLDLHENPIIAWAIRRAKRDPRTLGVVILYFLFVHGATGIMLTLMAAPGFRMKFDEFAMMTHILTWSANAFLFMLWVPTRYAQQIGTEREKRTLDFLRMTRVPSRKICFGTFAAAYLVPFLVALTSLPEVFIGCFSRHCDYLPGVLQAYIGLFSASLIAVSLSGLIAFLPKKGIQAASAAFLAVILLAIAGGMFAVPYFEPLGCLAPWGGLMAGIAHNDRESFHVTLFNTNVPGVLLQLPVALALAFIFLDATTRKIEEEGSGLLGLKDAGRLAVLVAVVSALTLSDHPGSRPYGYVGDGDYGPLLAGRFVILFITMLPLAADSAIHREEVVRGLARAPEPPHPDEVLSPWFPGGVILSIVGGATLLHVFMLPNDPERVAAVLTGAVVASALILVHLVFQATRLHFSLQTRNIMGVGALGALWFLPLLGSWGSGVIDLPRAVASVPSLFCPFVAITKAALGDPNGLSATGDLGPTAAALIALLLNVLLASGAVGLLRELTGRLKEFAATLTVLPADVFAPAGKVEKKCPQGHLYAAMWDACPHCPQATEKPSRI